MIEELQYPMSLEYHLFVGYDAYAMGLAIG